MELQERERLEILRDERKLLIEKTKWGTYAAVLILIPAFMNIYFLLSEREKTLFPVGNLIQLITSAALLWIIILCSLFLLIFIFRNYRRYQEIEREVDKMISIHPNKGFIEKAYEKLRNLISNH